MHDIVPILFAMAGMLALVSLLPPLAARLTIPYSVLLAAVGVGLGLVSQVLAGMPGLGAVGDFFESLRHFRLTSEAFLFLFLPILLFETALAVEVRRLLDDIAPILMLAVVAVLVTTFVVGFALAAVSDVGLVACLLLGATLATTDPAAVIGIFRDLGAPRRLCMLVEGESLLNDAAAIALFSLLLGMLTGSREADAAGAALAFATSFGGGIAVGFVLARVACTLAVILRNLALAEITLTVALAYASFIIAEHYFHVSGVVAVVAAALVMGSTGRTRLSPSTWGGLEQVWQQLGFWASSLIFLFAALPVSSMLYHVTMQELMLLAVLIVAALAARAMVLYGMLPVLGAAGLSERVTPAYKAVMLWGGLRGAISLALALAIMENPEVTLAVKRFVAVLATGYVLFTLFVNGTTLRPLIRLLGLDRLPPGEQAMRNRAMALTLSSIREEVQTVARDYQIDPALAQEVAEHYAARLADIERARDGEAGLIEADRDYAGLAILANREEELYLQHFKEGIISRTIVELLTERTSWLLDGARADGRAGYMAAAEQFLRYSVQMQWAMHLQRLLGIQGPLADRLAVRYEALLIIRLVLRELMVFNRRKLGLLVGNATVERLAETLELRLGGVERALGALKLQYPDFAAVLQRRYLGRAALRLEEAEYRTMQAESLISQEVLNDLERDLGDRRQALEAPIRLDLGLQLGELIARVPIFTGLDEHRRGAIARLLRPRLALPAQVLVRRGDRGDSMYFISSGSVEIRAPGLVAPVRLGSGDFFGELALIARQPRSADVVAIGYCQLLVLDERDFRRVVERDADLRRHIEEVAHARRLMLAGTQPA